MEFFLCIVGMVLVLEGLPYFGFPDKMKALMAIIRRQDDATLRTMGGSLMLLGLIIIFLARTMLGQG
jgi:uncharacterized protein YjeT (DUF2065 family)